MGTEKQRKKIMDKLRTTFIHADMKGMGLEEQKLIGRICSEHGVTIRKAKEYIQELLWSEFIERDEFGLWLKDKSYKGTKEVPLIRTNLDVEREIKEVFDGKQII